MADDKTPPDKLTPELKKKLDEALGKAGVTDKAIIAKAEDAADKVIPQIQDYAAAVQALHGSSGSPKDATKATIDMMTKGVELQAAEGKVLQKMGVEVATVSKIEAATMSMTRDQSAVIVAKGANGQKR